MYKLLRNLLFLLPPECVHHLTMHLLAKAAKVSLFKNGLRAAFSLEDSQLSKHLFGLTFKNPVGLAAGFDKNAKFLGPLECLGFGFIEIGTVTPKPQEGNAQPRLFRLKKDGALINRMGFNNEGADKIAATIRSWRETKNAVHGSAVLPMLVGGNIGKNKATPNEDAWKDYVYCFRALNPVVDYFVVNVSSPNTPGLRELQEKESLRKILVQVQSTNRSLNIIPKPLLLKIAPDLSREQMDDVISLAEEIALDGIVATNTTINRDGLGSSQKELDRIGAGGLSGIPLRKRSTEIIQYIHKKSEGRIPIIGSGGIFEPEDAIEKMNAGAGLIQVWTGFIYVGPSIVRRILRGILKSLSQN
ncbi:MAG: quinone-dependent dihydroorotate dehydrogenase [Chitinophagales bacterium]